MLGEFLDKTVSFFDRRFILAYWFPTLLSLSLGLIIFSWPKNWLPLNQYFSALKSGDYSSQLMIILGTLLFTLVFAYLLQAFSHSFIQFWEGYWPKPLWNWYKNNVKGIDEKWMRLKKERQNAQERIEISKNPDLYTTDQEYALRQEHAFSQKYAFLQEKLFYDYPSDKERLLPTHLGNVLRAAEDYAENTYGMHIIFWWPRLWLILPDAVKQQIDDALAPMVALLNLATQIGIMSLIGSVYLCAQYTGPWKIWAFTAACITLILGVIITTVAYRGAVSQAKIYGILIRSAVDIHRFDLLKFLHQPTPSNLVEEKILWENLFKWVYLNVQKNPTYAHDKSES